MPTVVKAVEDSTRIRANRATGWPVTAWVSRLKPDPLKRLHLDLGAAGKELTGCGADVRAAEPTQVQRARVDTEVRALADEVSAGPDAGLGGAVRRASVSRLADLGDRLDRALAATDLGAARIPLWAGLVRVLQWLLIARPRWRAPVARRASRCAAYLRLPEPPTPGAAAASRCPRCCCSAARAGVAAGPGVPAAGRVDRAVAGPGRPTGGCATAIAEVSEELVVEPVEAELAAYAAVRGTGLARALT